MRKTLSEEELRSVEAIFCDLDDTLLPASKRLSKRTIDAIQALVIPFYVDTGRNDAGINRGLLGLDDKNHLRISLNGNVLVRNGVVVKVAKYLPKDTALKILALVDQSFAPEELASIPYDPLHYYAKDLNSPHVYCEKKATHTMPILYGKIENLYSVSIIKILFNGTEESCNRVMRLLDSFQEKVSIVHNHPTQVEINPLGVDKGTGIEEMASIYGYDLRHCVSIGDSALDKGMLAKTGVKAVVSNGEKIVKDVANLLLPSNEEEGVAQLLEAITKAKREA